MIVVNWREKTSENLDNSDANFGDQHEAIFSTAEHFVKYFACKRFRNILIVNIDTSWNIIVDGVYLTGQGL